MQASYEAFRTAGAEVIALVVAPIERVESWCKSAGVSYPMLADTDHQASEAFGVYNLFDDGLAAPSVFVVDTDGTIVWHYVGQHINDRVSAQTILDRLP